MCPCEQVVCPCEQVVCACEQVVCACEQVVCACEQVVCPCEQVVCPCEQVVCACGQVVCVHVRMLGHSVSSTIAINAIGISTEHILYMQDMMVIIIYVHSPLFQLADTVSSSSLHTYMTCSRPKQNIDTCPCFL